MYTNFDVLHWYRHPSCFFKNLVRLYFFLFLLNVGSTFVVRGESVSIE